MNKTMQQPNGPGPTMAEQAAFVNGRGSRLIGSRDSLTDYAESAALFNRVSRQLTHKRRERETAQRLGKVIGTAKRH